MPLGMDMDMYLETQSAMTMIVCVVLSPDLCICV